MQMTPPLEPEIDEVLREFFPQGLPPSKTEAAIKARQCKVLTPLDERANNDVDSGLVGTPPPTIDASHW